MKTTVISIELEEIYDWNLPAWTGNRNNRSTINTDKFRRTGDGDGKVHNEVGSNRIGGGSEEVAAHKGSDAANGRSARSGAGDCKSSDSGGENSELKLHSGYRLLERRGWLFE